MKIGIDARTALSPKTGDRTYVLNLLRGLASLDLDAAQWQFHILLHAPDAAGVLPASPVFQNVVLAAPNSRLWTMGVLPAYARRANLDLVHVQYLAPPILPCPFVTAIHDVVWRAMPETFPRLHRQIMNFAMPRTARRAAGVLCGTQSAARDIQKYLPVASTKIHVTPYAIDPIYSAPIDETQIARVRGKYGLGEAPYILSVGVLQPRKNLSRLISAFEQLKKQHPNWPHQLVIVGKKGWGEETKIAEGKTQDSKIVFTGYVEDADLPALYAASSVFAYLSLYEGFGLPIVEAMACGAPVLTSHCGAMREVAGDAAELIDPLSIDDIARGLEEVLSSPERTQTLREKGRSRAAQFSVEMQAQSTLDVYAEVLRGTN